MDNQRNYLTEAFDIAEGKSMMIPERSHLLAVIDYIKRAEAIIEEEEQEEIINNGALGMGS